MLKYFLIAIVALAVVIVVAGCSPAKLPSEAQQFENCVKVKTFKRQGLLGSRTHIETMECEGEP